MGRNLDLLSLILRRLFLSLAALWLLVTLCFFSLRFIPGGPFDEEIYTNAEVRTYFVEKYQLHQPLFIQYQKYFSQILVGDWGESFVNPGQKVFDLVLESLPLSMFLGFLALVFALSIGIPTGAYLAHKKNSELDEISSILVTAVIAAPSFLVGPLLIAFFSLKLDWLPPALLEEPRSYILPVSVLGLRPLASLVRLTRTSLLENSKMQYALYAKAKGLSEWQILIRHVMRNSLAPVVTYTGTLAAAILNGSFVVELLFAIPGMSLRFVESLAERDYNVVIGFSFVFGCLLIFCHLIADIINLRLDPRLERRK